MRLYLSVLKVISGCLLLLFIVAACVKDSVPQHALKLWYKQPAVEWTDALPAGNGRLGAMVYGKTDLEQVQLNEESLWAGSKINNNNPEALSHLAEIRQLLFEGKITRALELSDKYLLGTPPRIRSYQTLGDLFLDFGEKNTETRNYRRELDLRTGIIHTTYEQNGVRFSRNLFVSAPDNVIVLHIEARDGRINTVLRLKREADATTRAGDHFLRMEGQIMDKDSPESGSGGPHMKFAAQLMARNTGGELLSGGDSLVIKDASSLLIILTAATNYKLDMLDFDPAVDPSDLCRQILQRAENKTYSQLRKTHVADHQQFFDRVEFSICGETSDSIPTDQRLKNVVEGKNDLHLEELYFQYGRYLLMGSSRAPGILPANLQGVWNNHLEAPWNSDYHTNINLQMNYWLADVCNLPETIEPLTGFFEKMIVPGSVTASQMYGCKGWTMHHNTDPFGRSGLMDGIQWGTFPMAGPWMSLHFWDHFLYTSDTAFLREKAWPILKGSAQFMLDFLTPDKHGHLITSPSYSPENAYYLPGTQMPMQLTYGATMDIQIASELLNACVKAAAALGESPAFIDSLESTASKLPPVRIGKNGTIMEWIEDYEEAEPGHRHISHLFGLHPGTQITPETPELFGAAEKTIEHRLAHGGGHTGWSRAWIINFYARLLNGEKAYEHLQALLGKSTLTNLFDTHPPFQIDGNFGGTAGIAEMLLQSQNGTLHVLPALPAAWKKGTVSGLRARGNYEVDIQWKEGELYRLTIRAGQNGSCKIKYLQYTIEFDAEKGIQYAFGPGLEKL
ncbi:MAG: glycoside hydrolase family 95 protein [Bacteroidales bacterium]|nr:glycoside hydrolase family 95 protein [Bacteroidales bacterium]